MIKLNRKAKPAILIDNEESWKSNLIDAITTYGGYSRIPKEQKERLLVHYRHQDIKNILFQSSLQKCAFCETKPGESGNIEVEHFAPKSIYPEMAFNWENFLPACRKCNGSKEDHDTVIEPIVNPYDTDPEDIFHYTDIRIAANDNQECIGERTIRVCGLNSVRLMKPRADILVSLHGFSQALEDAIKDYESADTDIKKRNRKRKIREALETIEVLANPSEKFSGFCKEYLQKCAPYHEAKRVVGE
ncbi:hypothetical protein [Zhongshania sp.]|uniref:hypothetical protein n=1 Tax=Zhongshania sp. TaxID=1971902 RepID=UPI00356A7BAE